MTAGDMKELQEESATSFGFEEELDDPNLAIIRPFDPERIKVNTIPAIVSLIVKRIEEKEIDLAPEFQRRARIWDQGRRSRLIESLLLKIPLPVFYVAADSKDRWSVVDGLQRLTTIYDFIRGDFSLTGLEYLTQLQGKFFQGLPRAFQRRIEETSLVVHMIQAGTPEEVMINIFKRINTGGLSLTGQEIRNALNKGPVRDFLQELAASEEFRLATFFSVRDDRMDAQECVLRFMAFKLRHWDDYASENSSLDLFLNKAMRELNELSVTDRSELAQQFFRAMKYAVAIFEDDAFRKRYDPEARRKIVSKALFEAWSVNLSNYSNEQLDTLVQRRSKLRSSFIKLMNENAEFEVSISSSTGTPARVRTRFAAVKALIDEVLE